MTVDPKDVRVACAEWVAKSAADLSEVHTVSLTSEPTRELWFKILPELDYEIAGGTWDEPRWAWHEHPWFSALGLTDEECYAAFRSSG